MKQNKLLWTASVLCAVFMGCTENDDGDNSYTNTSICGNGVLETGEICDDGNTRDGDGCSSVCYRETGYECPMAGSSCIKTGGKCGDGVLDPGEQCDDGNRREGDGCSSICEKEGVPIIVPPEQTTHCGNGTTEPNLGEACDDYNTDDLDGCSHDCQVEDGWTCNGGECWLPGCGNSVVEAGEACDFMLGNRGEYGLAEDGSFLCTTKCEYAPYCGDGIQNGPEACDLGVANNRSEYGDGCMSDCTKPPFCGDGFFSQGFEQCDPTTTQAGSGCEATCTPKAGWLCSAITDHASRRVPSLVTATPLMWARNAISPATAVRIVMRSRAINVFAARNPVRNAP